MDGRFHVGGVAAVLSLCLVTIFSTALPSSDSFAGPNDLSGGTGAARSTASTVGMNPANAGFVPRTEISIAPNLFEKNSLKIRYPGFEPIEKSSVGVGDIGSWMPSGVYKVSDNLGIGGYVVPPVTVEREFLKAPIVILGALDTVDIKAKVSVKGAFGGTFGYAISDSFAFGLQLGYTGYAIEANALPSSGGPTLATIFLESSSFDLKSGFIYEVVQGRFKVGASFGLFEMKKTSTRVDSPLLNAGGGGDGGGAEKGGQSSSSAGIPLNKILVGIAARLGSKMRLYVDVEYNRASPGAKDFSFVELSEKEKDSYSTVSPRIAAEIGLSPKMTFLGSFRYQPSNIGAGGRGEGSKAGYGSREIIGVFTGQEQLTPYWVMSGGMRHEFGRVGGASKGGDSPKGAKSRSVAKWQLAYGLVYQRGSLGIDENGELPGAYLQTKISVPLEIVYRF